MVPKALRFQDILPHTPSKSSITVWGMQNVFNHSWSHQNGLEETMHHSDRMLLEWPDLLKYVQDKNSTTHQFGKIPWNAILLGFRPRICDLGPLHLPGFENRMADSPFCYRWASTQLVRQETAYKPFWYKNGKSAVFKTGINLISSDIFLILEKLPFHRCITRLYGIHTV